MKKWIAACMATGLLATGAAFADPEAAPVDEAAPAAEEAATEAATDDAEEATDGEKADDAAEEATEAEKPEEAKGGKAQRSTAGNMDMEETDE